MKQKDSLVIVSGGNDGNMTVAHLTGVFSCNPQLKEEFYKLIDLQNG